MVASPQIEVVESAQIDDSTRDALRRLWGLAFGERFTEDDADHAFGGVHVLARDGGAIIGHASAVPREIRFGDEPWRIVGYVEAVATAPDRQREGVGRAVMAALHGEIARRWQLAMLSTGRATTFYESLGWTRWAGPSYTETASGVVADQNHGGLMVLPVGAASPDVLLSVTCRDRPGDAW